MGRVWALTRSNTGGERVPGTLSAPSENDQLHPGTSDWDPIGTINHLHRNTQAKRQNK